MQIFYEGANITASILGVQKFDFNKKYRLLDFCCFVELESGESIIFNSLTNKMVLVSAEELNAIKKLPKIFDEILIPLLEEWFIVPIDHDDKKTSDQVYEVLKLYNDTSYKNKFTILTTTDCNARCFYCYEHGVTRTHMTSETAETVADYIIKHCNKKKVSLNWFGGEPLYNYKVIDIIVDRLNKANIEFFSNMISNGYLFTNELIDHAFEKWNLEKVQITLDGTEEVYNKIKNYLNVVGSPFLTVINNIRKIAEKGISVSIRLNVSDENREDIYKLVDYLYDEFKDLEKVKVYCANLFDLEHRNNEAEIERLNNEYFKLRDYIESKGLLKRKFHKTDLSSRGCMAQNENSVVISPMGLLGRCEHFSEGEKMYGSIFTDEINEKSYNFWTEYSRVPECSDCIMYPICSGVSYCPDRDSRCGVAIKPLRIGNLKRDMLSEYKKFKAKQEKSN